MLRILCGRLEIVRNSLFRHFSTTKPVTMSVEENQINLKDSKENTYNINYVRKGHGTNAIILMPGALGSAATDFQPQIDQLPNLLTNYSIIGWDPPGYGKSTPPNRTFDLDFFHRDAFVANALMQSLGLNKYSVLGWSDGGITGLIMAAKNPNSIDKLVIWGSNSYILPEEKDIYESSYIQTSNISFCLIALCVESSMKLLCIFCIQAFEMFRNGRPKCANQWKRYTVLIIFQNCGLNGLTA